jgi:phosphinothricin acetyltransferase
LIRLAAPSDAAQVQAIYEPIVRDTTISFEVVPPGVDEIRARIEKTLAVLPWLVEERGGRILGYAYASRHRERPAYQWSVDVSCYVHADARGQGIGAALYRTLLGVLRRQGFHAAFAGITMPNAASERLHESVGFRRIGIYPEVGNKFGAWRDTAWYHARLGDAPDDPPPPRSLHDLGPGILDDP